METKHIFLFIALVLTVSACEQKADHADKATSKVETQNAPQPVVPTGNELPQKNKEVSPQVSKTQQVSPPVSDEANKPGKKTTGVGAGATNKTAVKKQETTEQVLDGGLPRVQEPENSRVAEQKQRGKKGEDEMMSEIAQHR